MRPDDVRAALDALAAEQPDPTTDAGAVIARGRRRIAQRRFAFVGVAAALIAGIAIVGAISRTNHATTSVSTGPPTTQVSTVSAPRASSLFPTALEGWKCGNPLQYTDDGGQTWRNISLPDAVPAKTYGCTAVPGGNAWITWWDNADATDWHVLRIRNLTDMQVFSLPPVPAADPNASVTFVDVDHGWFSTGLMSKAKRLYRTIDGGATWTLAAKNVPFDRGVTFANTEHGWSLNGNTLFRTADGGTTWRDAVLPAPPGSRAADVAHFQTAAVGNSVVIWSGTHISASRYRTFFDVSTDFGKTRSVRAGPAGFELPGFANNFFGAADGSHWALVSGAELRVTNDGGETWQTRPDLPVANGHVYFPLAFPTPNVGWLTTDEGLWRTEDAGLSWSNVTDGTKASPPPTSTTTAKPVAAAAIPPPPPPSPIAFATATEGWICGGRMTHTTDGFNQFAGATNDVTIPPATSNTAGYQPPLCAAAPGGNAWLLRGSSTPGRPEIVRIRGAGADVNVFPFANVPNAQVESIDFIDANNGWALVERTAAIKRDLYRTLDGGATWSLVLRDAPIFGQVDFSSSTRGWAEPSDGSSSIATTTDGGLTWQHVTVPTKQYRPKYTSVSPELVDGNVIVLNGTTSTGMMVTPFFDVSTDGGRTWTLRSGPKDAQISGTLPSSFSAADADHWALGSFNRLYVTNDGGRSWTEGAKFAGLDTLWYVVRSSAENMFVSGVGNPLNHSTVVLASRDGGNTWSTADSWAPPQTGNTVNFPGGIIGCPTHPLTPAPGGNPQPGLEAAAFQYIRSQRHWDPTAAATYPVNGSNPKGSYGDLFKFQLASCGQATMQNAWVVEVAGVPGQGGGGSTSQAQLALSHSADGWHVFGFYH